MYIAKYKYIDVQRQTEKSAQTLDERIGKWKDGMIGIQLKKEHDV